MYSFPTMLVCNDHSIFKYILLPLFCVSFWVGWGGGVEECQMQPPPPPPPGRIHASASPCNYLQVMFYSMHFI